jgi:hypothetical protein
MSTHNVNMFSRKTLKVLIGVKADTKLINTFSRNTHIYQEQPLFREDTQTGVQIVGLFQKGVRTLT